MILKISARAFEARLEDFRGGAACWSKAGLALNSSTIPAMVSAETGLGRSFDVPCFLMVVPGS
jgi:hypothetical protein